MKHTKHVKTITYSAIAVAVSIVLLAIARFAQVVDLTVLLLVAVIICIPFCEQLYAAGVLAYVIVAVAAPFVTGKYILSFMFVFWIGPSALVLAGWERTKYKKYFGILLAVVILNVAFWCQYALIKHFFFKEFYATTQILIKLKQKTSKVGFILLLLGLWHVFTILADYAVLFLYRYIYREIYVKRLHVEDNSEKKTILNDDDTDVFDN